MTVSCYRKSMRLFSLYNHYENKTQSIGLILDNHFYVCSQWFHAFRTLTNFNLVRRFIKFNNKCTAHLINLRTRLQFELLSVLSEWNHWSQLTILTYVRMLVSSPFFSFFCSATLSRQLRYVTFILKEPSFWASAIYLHINFWLLKANGLNSSTSWRSWRSY